MHSCDVLEACLRKHQICTAAMWLKHVCGEECTDWVDTAASRAQCHEIRAAFAAQGIIASRDVQVAP